MSRVLAIGDTHCPGMREDYVNFLKDVYKAWRCDAVVHIGDVVDWSAISMHQKLPGFPSAEDEYRLALDQVQKIYKAFPRLTVLIGNHDCRPTRLASTVNIPDFLLKTDQEIWRTSGWEYVPRYGSVVIDGVMYRHGDAGLGGLRSAARNSQSEFCSIVQGHHHSQCLVEWFCNQKSRVFAMQVGCGVDHDLLAFQYAKKFTRKPIVGCGIVIDGRFAYPEVMEL